MEAADSLAEWLGRLMFEDLSEGDATARIVGEIAKWADWQGWRVYQRAPSVFPLPPPLRGNSVLDVACARPGEQPIAIEVDRTDRQRTVDKLLAEAAAGRVAIWVRWGAGPFPPPPLPVRLVTVAATRKSGRWQTATAEKPAPQHSSAGGADGVEAPLWEM